MPVAMILLVALAGLSTALGLTVSQEKPSYTISGSHIYTENLIDSKPGTPKAFDWQESPLLNTGNSYDHKVKLGERLLRAAEAREAMDKCGSFLSFGDYSWCMKAMPKETPGFREKYGRIQEFVISNKSKAPSINPDDMLGLSFGIRTDDAWSELMSSMFNVRTRLYDCYFDGNEGPMVKDLHKGYSKKTPCMARHCYTAAYESKRVCNDDTTNNTKLFIAGNGKKYEPLSAILDGRPELSTFIKMDVEGSEWATLERLLQNEKDMAKIRTLDMEVHFNLDPTPGKMLPITQKSNIHHVKLMEKLADKFAVTGSSLETYLQKVIKNYKKLRQKNPKYMEDTEAYVHTQGGLILNQYTISFVNRKLL